MRLRKIFMKAFERAMNLHLGEEERWEESLVAVVREAAPVRESALARAARHGLDFDLGHRTTTMYVSVRPKDLTSRMWRSSHGVFVWDDDMDRTAREIEAEAHRIIDLELGITQGSEKCVAQNCGCARVKFWHEDAEAV